MKLTFGFVRNFLRMRFRLMCPLNSSVNWSSDTTGRSSSPGQAEIYRLLRMPSGNLSKTSTWCRLMGLILASSSAASKVSESASDILSSELSTWSLAMASNCDNMLETSMARLWAAANPTERGQKRS